MSEDDIDMLGADGQPPNRVDRDRRAPRFSWTPAYEATFFRSLCDSVHLGLRENSSFKAEAWERAAQALQGSHRAYPAKSHLINKSDNARKRFRLWRGLREDPEFVYNSLTRTVTASEEAWRAHIEREPLSRALRGRPFDHEDFMEILYPDVIGSGGAPKRIMKPRRRTDGQPGDETDMPGTSILNLQLDPSPANSPDKQHRASPAQNSAKDTLGTFVQHTRSTSASIPAQSTMSQTPSALTPPDESAHQARKRTLPPESMEPSLDAQSPPSGAPPSHALQSIDSPGKRARTSEPADPTLSCSSGVLANIAMLSGGGPCSSNTTPLSVPLAPLNASSPTIEELDLAKGKSGLRWQETALDSFFRDFADQDPDLQIKISETVLCDEYKARQHEAGGAPRRGLGTGRMAVVLWVAGPLKQQHVCTSQRLTPRWAQKHWLRSSVANDLLAVSYAEIAASGPKQSAQEAAAPQPPEIIPNESASTASLIDVDMPSVHTVRSDFLEQDVQTDTQAERRDREAEAAKAKAQSAKKNVAAKAQKADSWLTQYFSDLSDGSAGALALVNVAAVVGLSSYMGYRAWGLYERGSFDWKTAGTGIGILAAVGVVESVFGNYLYKGKKGSQ
ncbi:hypothetical protein HIM_02073 [Hirsutella minnesotensis 3608]|nr:hypothetical protein HIM_02073 [Hirsutella minnesotensis 3608]